MDWIIEGLRYFVIVFLFLTVLTGVAAALSWLAEKFLK